MNITVTIIGLDEIDLQSAVDRLLREHVREVRERDSASKLESVASKRQPGQRMDS